MSGRERMSESTVVIIGGGAAGLTAAISAARLGVGVTVLEADARVGRKILASGNGRCNLSNLSVAPSDFNQPAFVTPVLDRYPCQAVCAFFADLGLLTRADEEGRVYPSTNAAGSVLDVLRLECAELGVDIRCDFEVVRIAPGRNGFEVVSAKGERVVGHAVIVTTGGGGGLLADTGHAMVERTPVLAPLKTDAEPIRGLSGIRVRCSATIFAGGGSGGRAIATERGELLFREYGVSGIMVFDLSRYLEPGCTFSIDLFSDTDIAELESMLARRTESLAWRTAETFFAGMLHDRVARAILRATGVAPQAPAAELPVARLAAVLKDFRLSVLGIGDPRQAQVTRGGASIADFDAQTLASRRAEGLFAAGEVLDVDGRSGGFNLHWAWASGIVAGEAAARVALARAADGFRGTA